MKEKLEFLLRNKNHTATSLARLLDIQPSGLSHILSGRNKPSFDLVVKILRAFPDINPDWLLLDGKEVYRSELSPISGIDKFSDSDHPTSDTVANDSFGGENSEGENIEKNEQNQIFRQPINRDKKVERIIVLYTDHSFDSYSER